MESVNEVLIVSCSGNDDTNSSMFDVKTGNQIEVYKEGHSGRHSLDFISNDFLISAFEKNNKIKIWQFGNPNPGHRISTPGVISALSVSSCGDFCIAGIGKIVYIWEVNTGILESVLEYHTAEITCIRFSSDSFFFITGGKDGYVFVYPLFKVLSQQDSRNKSTPTFFWQDHADEVTDIHVGCVGIYSKVASVSKDETCRIYSLQYGNLLYTIHANVPLTSVTLDKCEYFLFLGCIDGNIYKVIVLGAEPEVHIEENDKNWVFVGHKKEITSLNVVNRGQHLVSGSADCSCRIWEIANLQCMKKIDVSGPVTNVITCLVPPGVKNKNHMPHLIPVDFNMNMSHDTNFVPMFINNYELTISESGAPGEFVDETVLNCPTDKFKLMVAAGSTTQSDLTRMNNEIYAMAINNVFEIGESHSESDSD